MKLRNVLKLNSWAFWYTTPDFGIYIILCSKRHKCICVWKTFFHSLLDLFNYCGKIGGKSPYFCGWDLVLVSDVSCLADHSWVAPVFTSRYNNISHMQGRKTISEGQRLDFWNFHFLPSMTGTDVAINWSETWTCLPFAFENILQRMFGKADSLLSIQRAPIYAKQNSISLLVLQS